MARRKRLPGAERREVIERASMEVFARKGYGSASMDEIARRSGVSVPVIYDHFPSKRALYRRLLERTRDELLDMWRTALSGDDLVEVRVPRAVEAWARYVEEHPFAARVYFRDASGDPEVSADQAEIHAGARAALGLLLGGQPGGEKVAGSADPLALEMAAEIMRAGLTGLAVWWTDHPGVSRDQIVAAALNVLWIGLERAGRGETRF